MSLSVFSVMEYIQEGTTKLSFQNVRYEVEMKDKKRLKQKMTKKKEEKDRLTKRESEKDVG